MIFYKVMLKINFFIKKFIIYWCGEWLLVNEKVIIIVTKTVCFLYIKIMLEIQIILQKNLQTDNVMSDYW